MMGLSVTRPAPSQLWKLLLIIRRQPCNTSRVLRRVPALTLLALSEVHPKSLVEASQSKRETLFNQEEGASCTTDPDASTPSEDAGFPTVVHGAMLEGSTVPRETESSDIFQSKPPQSKVFIYCRYKKKRFHSLSRIIH